MSLVATNLEFAQESSVALPCSATGRCVRAGVLVALVAAPLGFGATNPVVSLVLVGMAWLLFVAWLGDGIRSEGIGVTTWPVALPALLLVAFTSLHWVTGLSANPLATRLEWLRWLGYFALAVVAGESFVTLERLKGLVRTLAVAGLLIALLGITQYLTGSAKIYWLVEPTQGGWIFGPYVNRNHFAGLMELWIPMALALALVPDCTFGRRWLWSLVALTMTAAVAFSGSRGGILAVGFGILLFALAAAAWRGRRAFVGLLVAVLLTAGVVWSLDRGEVFERYKQSLQPRLLKQDEASLNRMEAWLGSFEIFEAHWLTGTGLDTFVVHFPAVRRFWTDKVWTHAHNDFLQFAAETGVVGLFLGTWMLVAGAREAFRNLERTRGTATGALLVGMACGCAAFLFHGWLDFNFHVPANAASFTVLAAVLTRRGWDEN
jgi:O-antigen ligase